MYLYKSVYLEITQELRKRVITEEFRDIKRDTLQSIVMGVSEVI